MAKSKKRRKLLVFSVIAVALMGLTALVILKKREIVITVQTEKVARRNLTELVMANGRIQPVLQVKISAERQQVIGVRLGAAEQTPGDQIIHTVGRVAADETRIFRITAAVDGVLAVVLALLLPGNLHIIIASVLAATIGFALRRRYAREEG